MRCLLPLLCVGLFTVVTIPPSTARADSGDQAGILVLPFSTPRGMAQPWLGGAIQQDLFTDLAQGTHLRVMAPSAAPPAGDADAAMNAAQDQRASMVVFGQIQSQGSDLRLTGQVLDVASGKAIGSLKATGPSTDLFHLEDALAGQALAALPRSVLSDAAIKAFTAGPQNAAPGTPAAPPQAAYPPAAASQYAPPQQQRQYNYYAPSDYAPAYVPAPTYAYDYGYPAPVYTYGCPSFDLYPYFGIGGGLFFGADFDNFGFHRDRFGHGRDFDGDRRFGQNNLGHRGFGARGLNGTVGSFDSGRVGVSRGGTFAAPGFVRPSFSRPSFSRPGGAIGRFQTASHFGGGFSGGFHGGGFGGGGFRGGGGFHGGGGGRR